MVAVRGPTGVRAAPGLSFADAAPGAWGSHGGSPPAGIARVRLDAYSISP